MSPAAWGSFGQETTPSSSYFPPTLHCFGSIFTTRRNYLITMPSQFSSKRERCLWTLGRFQKSATESQTHTAHTFHELSLKLVQGLFQWHCQDHRDASELFRAVLELSERYCDAAALEGVYDLTATICSEEASRQRKEQAEKRATGRGYPSPLGERRSSPADNDDLHRHPTPPGTPKPHVQARVDDWFAKLDRGARPGAVNGDGLLPPEPDGLLPPEPPHQMSTPEPLKSSPSTEADQTRSSSRKRRAMSDPGDSPPRKQVISILRFGEAARATKRRWEDNEAQSHPLKRKRLEEAPNAREGREMSSVLGKRRDADVVPPCIHRPARNEAVERIEPSLKRPRLREVSQFKATSLAPRMPLGQSSKRRRRRRSRSLGR